MRIYGEATNLTTEMAYTPKMECAPFCISLFAYSVNGFHELFINHCGLLFQPEQICSTHP